MSSRLFSVVGTIGLLSLFQAPGQPQFDHEHGRWGEILAEHVRGDRFDYLELSEDRAALDVYLAELQAVTPKELASWERDQQHAFWINVYNARVVALIVDHYPLESIEDLSTEELAVWDLELIPMPAFDPDGEGRPLSLNEVEHAILRPTFEDARVHTAVNCASVGCPPLAAEAFVAERLDEQLDARMHAFLADERRNRLDARAGTLQLSRIFEWFAADFERDAKSVRRFVSRYAPGEDRAWIEGAELEYLDYDWDLNDVEREDG